MLAEGNSVKEIACDLNLSVKTVEAHKFNLMRKLDIHNKAQLVQYAIPKRSSRFPTWPGSALLGYTPFVMKKVFALVAPALALSQQTGPPAPTIEEYEPQRHACRAEA